MISEVLNIINKRELYVLTIALGILFSFSLFLNNTLFILSIVLVPVLLVFFYLILEHKHLLLYLVFASSIFYLETGDGITLVDMIYFSTLSGFILIFLIPSVFTLNLPASNRLDKHFIFFLLLIGYAIAIGVLYRAAPYSIFGDAAFYLPIPTYFALRALTHNNANWQRIVLYTFIFIVLYVAIRNIINYRELILSAYMQWQAEKARDSSNEVLLLTGSLFFFIYSVNVRKASYAVLSFVGFVVVFLALILTQSRGYWLAFILSFIVLVFISKPKERKRLILFTSILALVGFSISYVFFYEKLQIVFDALLSRFQTIGQGELDTSLKERLFESKAVIDRILTNPVSGHGFGTTYRREALFYNIVQYKSFIHNGYLLAWYKFGILGLLFFLKLYYELIKGSYKIAQQSDQLIIKTLAYTSVSVLAGLLLVNNTSPQFYHFDSLLVIVLIAVFLTLQNKNNSNSSLDSRN